jgi:hypothetical protein
VKWGRGKGNNDSKKESEKRTHSSSSDYTRKDPMNFDKYDCYSILGVTHNAGADEIKRAYRRLALQYHPDRNKSQEATAIFTAIQIAYDTLTDAAKRQKYDSTIPALETSHQSKIKVVLEGAYSEGFVLDDRASISIMNTDEAIVVENSITLPTIWINSPNSQKQYSIFTDVAYERLFRAIYAIIDPKENLDDTEIVGTPELRAHFDARLWNRGQTNVSIYCYSSMTFTIINGVPFLYLHGAKYHNAHHEITMEFYTKLKDAISKIIQAELEGTVEVPKEEQEPEKLFEPIKHVTELRLPPREVCEAFTNICRTKSAQAAIEMLSKVYGVPTMKTVFQHRFPINDMVCTDALAVYYGDDLTAYFKPEGTSMTTILHEFYHHLVNCYGVRQTLDYQLLPDPVTGYYARNEREERAADSYAKTFIKRVFG